MVQTENPFGLAGKRVLVTGASGGIGRAIAFLLSRLGAVVLCAGRDKDRLEETVAGLVGVGHSLHLRDMTNTAPLRSWVAGLGPLHGFVHAAGIQDLTPLGQLSEAGWRQLLVVNAEAALSICMVFQSRKVAGGSGGSVVLISSVMGHLGAPGRAAYSMSKGAVEGLTRSLALELAPRHIRVNCVAPGYVQTRMYESVAATLSDEQVKGLERMHPLGVGTADDVAGAVAFLLGDCSRWITGSVLAVDGGYSAQ